MKYLLSLLIVVLTGCASLESSGTAHPQVDALVREFTQTAFEGRRLVDVHKSFPEPLLDHYHDLGTTIHWNSPGEREQVYFQGDRHCFSQSNEEILLSAVLISCRRSSAAGAAEQLQHWLQIVDASAKLPEEFFNAPEGAETQRTWKVGDRTVHVRIWLSEQPRFWMGVFNIYPEEVVIISAKQQPN